MVDNADFTPSQVGGLFTFLARQLAKPDNTLFVNRKLFDQVTSSCYTFSLFWTRPSSKQFQCLFSISDVTTSQKPHDHEQIHWFPHLDHTIESCLDLEEKLEPLFSLKSSFQICDVAQTQTFLSACLQVSCSCIGPPPAPLCSQSIHSSGKVEARVCAHKVFRLY